MEATGHRYSRKAVAELFPDRIKPSKGFGREDCGLLRTGARHLGTAGSGLGIFLVEGDSRQCLREWASRRERLSIVGAFGWALFGQVTANGAFEEMLPNLRLEWTWPSPSIGKM
jgi:hypothetical protein